MNNNTIDIAIQFDDKGVPTRWNTYVTRPNDITFGLVYESISFLSSLKDNPNTKQVQEMIDLVLRMYGNQFDKLTLIDGLPSHTATVELFNQINFIANGKNIDDELVETEAKSTTIGSWEDSKNSMKKHYQNMVKEGQQSASDVLNLPFYFVFDELNKKSESTVKKTNSMLSAFGGLG